MKKKAETKTHFAHGKMAVNENLAQGVHRPNTQASSPGWLHGRNKVVLEHVGAEVGRQNHNKSKTEKLCAVFNSTSTNSSLHPSRIQLQYLKSDPVLNVNGSWLFGVSSRRGECWACMWESRGLEKLYPVRQGRYIMHLNGLKSACVGEQRDQIFAGRSSPKNELD